ncbi:neprilysin-1-like [Amblyomma americanum]
MTVVTPDVLREVTYITCRVRDTVKATLSNSSWLPGASRKAALKKIQTMRIIIAFPFNLTGLSALEHFYADMPDVAVKESSFLLSWLNASRFLRRVQMKHQDEILFTLGWVNAQHTYATNTVNLAGALLQPVIFYHGAPAVYNYGGIGQLIGHEMMHAFDVVGRQANGRGMRTSWWPKQATDKYLEQTSCLRDIHREALRKRALVLNHTVDSENLADVMGIRMAFDALQNLTSVKLKVTELRRATTTVGNVAGFTNHQLFFIGHCAKVCDPKVPPRQRDASKSYAPSWARCVVPLMNMPEFADAFHCAPGTFMNPERKCRFW